MEETVLNQYRGQVRRRLLFLGIILAGLALLIVVGITLGSSRLPLAKVIATFSGRADPVATRIIWYIRVPQVLAAVFGAAFAIIFLNAGSLQSSSTDAVLLNNPYLVSGTAFLWSLVATAFILLIARWRGATPETKLPKV
jgi:iron complex transport system permease protein